MIEYVYEVRGTNDPIDGDHVRFTTRAEAVEYKNSVVDKYPEAAVYMISYEFDDEDGNDGVFSVPKKLHEIQVSGPEVDAALADPTVPNSCEGDASGFRLPKEDDDLDDDELLVDAESDDHDESDVDDIETESFAEELFSEVAKMKESNSLEETVETDNLEKELEQTKQEYEEVAADKSTPKNKAKEQELVMKMADLKNKLALEAAHKEN